MNVSLNKVKAHSNRYSFNDMADQHAKSEINNNSIIVFSDQNITDKQFSIYQNRIYIDKHIRKFIKNVDKINHLQE